MKFKYINTDQFTPESRSHSNENLCNTITDFLKQVAKNNDLSDEQIDRIADYYLDLHFDASDILNKAMGGIVEILNLTDCEVPINYLSVLLFKPIIVSHLQGVATAYSNDAIDREDIENQLEMIMKLVVNGYIQMYQKITGHKFPTDRTISFDLSE